MQSHATATPAELKRLLGAKLVASKLPKNAEKDLRLVIEPPPSGETHPCGFRIPYFDFSGKTTDFYRYRYLTDPAPTGFSKQMKTKPLRYVQPVDTLNEIYMPPRRKWATVKGEVDEPLLITEGELKAASVVYNTDYACIGLGGVWCWRSKKHSLTMLPQLEEFEWQGREVYIVFDSDAITNPDVRSAECALAKSLARRGAYVYIARMPALDGEKTGLDDFLFKSDAAALNVILEEAAAWGEHEALIQLNSEVAYVEQPSMVVRLTTERGVPTYAEMNARTFVEEVYKPRKHLVTEETQKGPREVVKYTAKEWFEWPGRATYRTTTYAPGQPRVLNDGTLNSWSGWGVEPIRGDVRPWYDLLRHLFGEDDTSRSWLERWLAYPMQHPGAKMRSAAIVWGTQHGTGKSWLGELISAIYGENATTIDDKQLNSTFNDWAYRKQFVCLDEAGGEYTYRRERSALTRELNRLITQPTFGINRKHMPVLETPNVFNLYFNGNEADSLCIPKNDRRFFVHEVRTQARMPESLRAALEVWRDNGGLRHLFHHLLNLDLEDMSPTTIPPMTESKDAMIDVNRNMIESWVVDAASDPDRMITDGADPVPWSLVTMKEIITMIDPEDRQHLAWNVVGPILRRYGFRPVYRAQSVPTKAGALRLWAVRNVEYLSTATGPELAEVYEIERKLIKKPATAQKVVKFRRKKL